MAKMTGINEMKRLLAPSIKLLYKEPLVIKKGSMQYLWDSKGNKYLDCFGGIVTVSVGHCHPKVNAALKDQIDKLWHTTSIYITEPILEYTQKLTQKLPPHLNVCYFVNSGSEANDLALTLTRLHTGRFDVLTLRNAYHGLTQAVQGASNLGTWKQPFPNGFGITRMMCPDPYRGPWGGKNCRDSLVQPKRSCECSDKQCKACDRYINELHNALKYEYASENGVAGMLIESIQGVGGVVQFPKEFIKRAFDTIHSKGGICISDEVQTGFGRLGSHFWGFQSQDANPDIVTMAKGIANGFPMGAVVTTEEIARSHSKPLYMNTFGGNPLACTVAKAVLEVIEEEKLQENSENMGEFVIRELQRIDNRLIGDIRGKGLMIGIELVNEDGEPLEASRMANMFEETKNRGVLFGKGSIDGNVLRLKPPMCINKSDAQFAVDVLSSALKTVL